MHVSSSPSKLGPPNMATLSDPESPLPRGGLPFLPEGLLTFHSRLSSWALPHGGAMGLQLPLLAQFPLQEVSPKFLRAFRTL